MMKMKKSFLFLAAIGAITLTSCSNDDFVGQGPGTTPAEKSEAIVFSGGATKQTRADLYGAAAAEKLGNKFVVYGTKHTTAEDKTADNDAVVFNNFQVGYTANTAGTTESNSSDWEYVGKQAYDATPTSQAIKYWDYSAGQGYTFYAFSSSDISYPANASDKVSVTKVTTDETSLYNKGYAVTVKPEATMNNLYFSDRVPVAKGDYDKTVSFTFRNIGAKVRVGFYETIPGYDVKIDKFYIRNPTGEPNEPVTSFAAMNLPKTDCFYASLQNVKRDKAQTLNVTYYDNTDATTENRPKLTNPTAGYYYTFWTGKDAINTKLSDNAGAPTWTVSGGEYTPVFPYEANTNPMLVKLDFTMTATDGSGDVIKVRGARAIVPAEYVKWKSNFAYTYIFKISDKSNGTTGAVDENGDPTEDPEGLKPITFDAIVVDVTEELQQTITSVSTNSITTYAKGAITDDYQFGEPIYVAVTNNGNNSATSHPVITPTAIGNTATEAQVYELSKAASEAEVFAQLTGSSMGITMTDVSGASIETTVPLADGTTPSISNVKFTPTGTSGTPKYYAYVYTTTAYVAPTYAAADTYNSSLTYYMKTDNDVYYAVAVPTSAAFDEHKAKLFVAESAGTPGVYDIKVIKVQ